MAHMDSVRKSCQEPGLRKGEKHTANLQCDTVEWHTGWLVAVDTEMSPRDTSPPRVTTSQAEVGPLAGGVCEHLHVFTAFPQVQERAVLIREWGLWVQAASLETGDECSPEPFSFNLSISDVSINTHCRRCHQTHAILALQCWAEQARISGCPPPSAPKVYREKTWGERSGTLQQKDFGLWFKNSQSFLQPVEFLTAGFNTALLPPCPSLFGMANSPGQPLHHWRHQQLCNPPNFSCWHYKHFLCL